MSQHECKRCGESKPAGDMLARGGKPSTVCRDCWAAGRSKTGKSGGGKAVKPRTAKPEPAPVTIAASLEVAAGLGVRASIEDGQLCLEQDRPDGDTVYTHSLQLAPHEARQLVDWIAAQVRA